MFILLYFTAISSVSKVNNMSKIVIFNTEYAEGTEGTKNFSFENKKTSVSVACAEKHQPINQSTSQSISQLINQSIN